MLIIPIVLFLQVRRPSRIKITEERVDFSLKHRSQVLFVRDNKFFIDVHWRLIDLERYNKVTNIDLDRIWKHKQSLNIEGNPTCQLSLNDTIIYQCLHLAIQHAFKGLIMYVDIAVKQGDLYQLGIDPELI